VTRRAAVRLLADQIQEVMGEDPQRGSAGINTGINNQVQPAYPTWTSASRPLLAHLAARAVSRARTSASSRRDSASSARAAPHLMRS